MFSALARDAEKTENRSENPTAEQAILQIQGRLRPARTSNLQQRSSPAGRSRRWLARDEVRNENSTPLQNEHDRSKWNAKVIPFSHYPFVWNGAAVDDRGQPPIPLGQAVECRRRGPHW